MKPLVWAHIKLKVSSLWHVLPPMPSHQKLLDSDLDDGDLTESPDPANITNVDAFEELTWNNSFFARTTPNQPTNDESPDMPDTPEPWSNEIEAGDSEAMLTVVIDHFPSANAGAPIHGMQHRDSPSNSHRGMKGYVIWSPFVSQCGWLFVCWMFLTYQEAHRKCTLASTQPSTLTTSSRPATTNGPPLAKQTWNNGVCIIKMGSWSDQWS